MIQSSEEKTVTSTYQNEIDLKEIFNSIFKFKWSILMIMMFSFIISIYSVYFKTPLYLSSALIEVKSGGKQGMSSDGDFLGSAFSNFGSENVEKDIELLKTFNINNHALDKVDFKVDYFITKRLKKREIYGNIIPIKIHHIKIIDTSIVGRPIKFISYENGYSLEVENTIKTKLFHFLFNKHIVELNSEIIYDYGTTISTDYFELNIDKKSTINQKNFKEDVSRHISSIVEKRVMQSLGEVCDGCDRDYY